MEEPIEIVACVLGTPRSDHKSAGSVRICGNTITVAQTLHGPLSKTTTATFNFSACLEERLPVNGLFNKLSAKTSNCFSGINSSILFFGLTGSERNRIIYGTNEVQGLIENYLRDIQQQFPQYENGGISITLACYDVNNETLKDKFGVDRQVRVAEDISVDGFRDSLKRLSINDEEGLQNACHQLRRLCVTGLASSSHVVTEIEVMITQIDTQRREAKRLISRLAIYDIAGSGSSAIAPLITRESASLQSSMIALRTVVQALSINSASKRSGREYSDAGVIPYKSSVLTQVLREALGGNSSTTLVALVSHATNQVDDTMATLSFANSVAEVRNFTSEVELPCSILNRAVNREIQSLWQKYELETRAQVRDSFVRRQTRFSVGALETLKQAPGNHEEEIRIYKERAVAAERYYNECAETLWETYQSKGAELAKEYEEKLEALEARQKLQVPAISDATEYLIEHASVLLIQVTWRRYKFKQVHALLTYERDLRRADRSRYAEESAIALRRALDEAKKASDQVLQSSATNHQAELSRLLAQSTYQAEQARVQMTELEQKIRAMSAVEEDLRTQLLTKSNELISLRDVIFAKTGELAELQFKVDASSRDAKLIEELKARLGNSEQETHRLREQVASHMTKLAMTVDSENLARELKDARSDAQKLREDLDRQTRRAKEVEDALMQANHSIHERERELQATKGKLSDAETRADEALEKLTERIAEQQAKIAELESAMNVQSQTELETLKERENNIEALEEQLRAAQANAQELAIKLEAEEIAKKVQAEALEQDKERLWPDEQELKLLRHKVKGLEMKLKTDKASMERAIQERDQRLKDLERKNNELRAREKAEIEKKASELKEKETAVKRLQADLKITKENSLKEVQDRDRRLDEAERKARERDQAEAKMAPAAGTSFLQYKRDSRQRDSVNRRLSTISVIQPATAVSFTSTSLQQMEDLLCVRVDVESFDDRTFQACTSSVNPDDPTTRTFHVKSPLNDLKRGRWTRLRIKVLHGSVHHVDEVTNVCLEHVMSRDRSLMHKLRIDKTELDRDNAVQSVVCEWDPSSQATSAFAQESSGAYGDHDHHCFCFNQMAESGPMVLHATFKINDSQVHWEYPLRLKSNTTSVMEMIPRLGAVFASTRRASDDVKHEYINSSWFVVENDSGNARAGPLSNGQRVVLHSGYLQKHQTHRGGTVQRWFIFAPPFLLCYNDVMHAANDFSKARALPHSANRAMRIAATTKVSVAQPKANLMDCLEFVVLSEEKTWQLHASNKEDLERWTAALNSWIAREKELHPMSIVGPGRMAAPGMVEEDDDDY